MRSAPALALPILLLAAACGTEKLQASALRPASIATTPPVHGPVSAHGISTTKKAAGNSHGTAAGSTSMCLTSGLAVRLGHPGYAAGSRYEPIVFTNATEATCTITGYPGVSFVAPGTGHQVGAAAARNAQHATAAVALAPGASASAMLQVVNHANYPPADCGATPVSGLRVYPPGNAAAAYIPFDGSMQSACSTQVEQLTVEAVASGSTG